MRIFLFIFVFLAANANAFYICTGKVEGLTLKPANGQVLVERIGELKWPVLCSVEQEQNGIAPDSCQAIFSLLLSAELSGSDVKFWFNDENTGGNCSSHKAWDFLRGWYLGPQILN